MMACLDLPAIARELAAPYTGEPLSVREVVIDSRRVQAGDLFVALPGERVDGHDYVAAAARAGAVAAIVEREIEREDAEALPLLRVASGLAALTTLGLANRRASSATVLAITGSCGKTSVKNMCRAIFGGAGPTVATAGNYNNEIGVPLTLARIQDDTAYAVVEMGATGRGEIAHLCTLARPQIATVLNAMEAHLDGFGTVADVADIKAEIFDGLGGQGIAVLNADAPWAGLWQERIEASGARTVTWSLRGAADVTATELQDRGLQGTDFTLCIHGQSRPLRLPLPGRHSVGNALAAAALASAAGLDLEVIAAGLERTEAEPGRLRPESLPDGTVLIDDSYNANPGSVRAAIALLAATPGSRALILGEMLELGENSASMHAEMGHLAAERGLETFIGVGSALAPAVEAFGAGAELYPDRESLAPALEGLLRSSDTILVKGSRGAAMESVLTALRAAAAPSPAPSAAPDQGEGVAC